MLWTLALAAAAFDGRVEDASLHPAVALEVTTGSTAPRECSGLIIAPTWVATAASCIRGAESSQVLAGVDTARPTATTTARRWISHPDYKPANGRNDIAVIEIDERAIRAYIPVLMGLFVFVEPFETTVVGYGWGEILPTGEQGQGVRKDVRFSVPGGWGPRFEGSVSEMRSTGPCEGDGGAPLVLWTGSPYRYIAQGLLHEPEPPCSSAEARFEPFGKHREWLNDLDIPWSAPTLAYFGCRVQGDRTFAAAPLEVECLLDPPDPAIGRSPRIDFGDGEVGRDWRVQHTYTTSGSFQIEGCYDDDRQTEPLCMEFRRVISVCAEPTVTLDFEHLEDLTWRIDEDLGDYPEECSDALALTIRDPKAPADDVVLRSRPFIFAFPHRGTFEVELEVTSRGLDQVTGRVTETFEARPPGGCATAPIPSTPWALAVLPRLAVLARRRRA